jgi:uncharacterized protein (TIGR00255 family)
METARVGIASMTGFARAQGEAHGVSWVWEVKSVNGRALDLRLRLAPGFDRLEPELRAALARWLRRGNVSANLTVVRIAAPALRINREALAQLIGLIDELGGEIEAAPPRLDGLLALRGVVETVEDEDEAVAAARCGEILASWGRALDLLTTARAEEGARIGRLLENQLGEMTALTAKATLCAASQPRAIRERLLAALADLIGAGGAPPLPEDRVAQEVALIAARADIREEIERLRAHIEQAGELLSADDAVGRRLDFLCQELNREANTLCSKSADIELTRIGMALKTVIEQFREQVQNIE